MIQRDRVKLAMDRLQLSQAELAKRVGVSAAAIQQILNGTTRRTRVLPELAEALGVDEKWLDGRSDTPSRQMINHFADEDHATVKLLHIIPRGNPTFDEEYEPEAWPFIATKKWVERISGGAPENELIMTAAGDSRMSPTFQKGDDLLIRVRNNFDGDPDGIWVVVHGDATMLRRVRKLPGGKYLLGVDNPTFPSIEVEEQHVRFIGKVVWQGRTLSQ